MVTLYGAPELDSGPHISSKPYYSSEDAFCDSRRLRNNNSLRPLCFYPSICFSQRTENTKQFSGTNRIRCILPTLCLRKSLFIVKEKRIGDALLFLVDKKVIKERELTHPCKLLPFGMLSLHTNSSTYYLADPAWFR